MNRPKAYYRGQRDKHIARKKRIIRDLNGYWHYDHDGTLSKGKIHCSCWMCRSKSYDNRTLMDKKRISAMNNDMYEYKIA